MRWTTANWIGFYRFTLPVPGTFSAEGPGRWEILLDWRRNWKQLWEREKNKKLFAATTGRHALRFKALVHARSELEMAATIGQSALTPGATVTVRVRLTQYESIPIEAAKVRTLVRFPDNSEIIYYPNPIAEGVYEVAFTANLSEPPLFELLLKVTVCAVRVHARLFEPRWWPGGDREPPSSDGDSWCRLILCLLESKTIDPEVLKRLGVNVEGLLRCCPPEEPEGKFKQQAHLTAAEPVARPPAGKKAREKSSAARP
jgi:hypothetical protein